MKPAFLLSKSLELVRIEQDPVRVFVSVQFDRRFEFQKRRQHLIGADDETLSVVAMLHLQSRLSAPRNQRLRHSPNSNQPR